MTYFNRGGGFGGNRDSGRQGFGGGPRRGGSSFGDYDKPALHKATCAECGRDCEVPFRPNGSRPVFCSSCFETKGGDQDRPRRGESRSSFGGNSRTMFDRRPSYNDNESNLTSKPQTDLDLRAINIKLDRILDLMTRKSLPEDIEIIAKDKVKKTKAIKKLIQQGLEEAPKN